MGLRLINEAAFQRAPQLVVFDLDDTLYAYGPAHEAALAAAAKKAQSLFGAVPEAFAAAYAAARADVHARLKGQASSHSRLLYFTGLGERLGIGAQPAIALDLEQTYWMTFLNAAAFFPGAVDLLDELRLARIPMALLTDLTAQIQYRKLVYWDLDRYFSAIVTSEESGADKPAQAGFDLLRAKLGDTPTVVWAIGDSAEKDLASAKRLMGATTLLRTAHPDNAAGEGVDAAFDDFVAVRRLVARLAEAETTQQNAPRR